MTLPLINAARLVMFIAAGEEKADAVRGVLQPKDSVPSLPAQFVRPVNGKALRHIREIVLERRAQNILVVSHKATIRLVIASLLGLRLMLFNDVSHYAHQRVLACSSHTETALARR